MSVQLQWMLVAAVAATGLCAATFGAILVQRADQTLEQLSLKPVPLPARPAPPSRGSDFALTLGAPLETETVLSWLQQASRRTSITVQSSSFSRRPPSSAALGRLELTLELSGSYADTKQVLAELFARAPQLTLQRLHMVPASDAAGTGVVQTQALLVFWSAPSQPAR